jgi:hypothetical protein
MRLLQAKKRLLLKRRQMGIKEIVINMPFLGVQPSRGLVGTAGIDADAVTSAKIADDQIDSEHYAAGSIDTAHIAANQIDGTLTKDALIADYSDVTITAADLIMYGDATDSNNTKRDTVQGILDLGGGAWNIIGTVEASNDASLTITGLDSTYDTYAIGISDMHPVTDNVHAYLRLGDSGGVDSGASDYSWIMSSMYADSTSGAEHYEEDDADAQIILQFSGGANIGTAAGEGFGAMIYLHRPGDGTTYPMLTWNFAFLDNNTVFASGLGGGVRKSVIAVDRLTFLFSSGNVSTGRMTCWGVAHA